MNEVQLFSNASVLLSYLKEKKQFVINAPLDIDIIAKELGISVESDSFIEKNIVGKILFENERPIIKINSLQNNYEPRRRFTLAHEIGHYCLHSANTKKEFSDSQKTMSRTESYWDAYESEANNFAAQLLMPKALIIEECQKIIDEYSKHNNQKAIPMRLFIETMSDKFEVSSKAMEYRLKNIGIINHT